MPAVSHAEAVATMAEHGQAVVDYVQDAFGSASNNPAGSWYDICEWWLTTAVELWASCISHDVVNALESKRFHADEADEEVG